jgi:hypothetical protein
VVGRIKEKRRPSVAKKAAGRLVILGKVGERVFPGLMRLRKKADFLAEWAKSIPQGRKEAAEKGRKSDSIRGRA